MNHHPAGGNQLMDLMKANMMMNSRENPLYAFVMLTVLELVMKYVTQFIEYAKKSIDKWLGLQYKRTIDALPVTMNGNKLNEDEIFDAVFERRYGSRRSELEFDKVDAVLFKLAEMAHIRKTIYAKNVYMVNYKESIKITEHIYFQLIDIQYEDTGEISLIQFRLFTYNGDSSHIKKYVDMCEREYNIVKSNKLGTETFFFDHISYDKNIKEIPSKERVVFTRTPFFSNRCLDNVFFENKKEVSVRLELFLKNKEWYNRRGIPHNLAMLLYGSPGCGKTSFIKAVANMTGRHIININLSQIKTKSQLKHIFYSDNLWVVEKNATNGRPFESYIIPRNKRLYVIEDIDAVEGEILLKRGNRDANKTPVEKSTSKIESKFVIDEPAGGPQPFGMFGGGGGKYSQIDEAFSGGSVQDNSRKRQQTRDKYAVTDTEEDEEKFDKMDLASILNVLDGTLETPERMLIISSNYPEKLDEALIRPGRIDMIVEFKKASVEIIREMYKCFYESEPDQERLNLIEDYKWSPAEVSQIMFKNYNQPEKCLNDLIEHDPKRYFQFSYFSDEKFKYSESEKSDSTSESG